jgi:hypothetical protein
MLTSSGSLKVKSDEDPAAHFGQEMGRRAPPLEAFEPFGSRVLMKLTGRRMLLRI